MNEIIKKPSYEEVATKLKALELELAALKKQDNTMIRLLSEDFKRLVDRSQDAIYQFDIESRSFSFFNKRFLALFAIEEKGNAKWILETATSIRYKGRRAALANFMDISNSKQFDQECIEKEKLLSILEMAGAVGHELNNITAVTS